MLEKANKPDQRSLYYRLIRSRLYKLKRYEEAKNYLQLAVGLLPADPIVNDHGDAHGKMEKIQARYYWNYVLKLEKTEEN